MNRRTAGVIATILSGIAVPAFLAIGIHELDYASGHPGHYGPAKVIAWGAFVGALLSVAVGLLALTTVNDER